MFFGIHNDMAFFVLDEPLDFSGPNVQPIKLAGPGVQPSTESRACTASGWGSVDIGGATTKDLYFVNIDYINDTDCKSDWSWTAFVFAEENICAGTEAGGESVCQVSFR
jgi:hypothetical protein